MTTADEIEALRQESEHLSRAISQAKEKAKVTQDYAETVLMRFEAMIQETRIGRSRDG